MGVVYDAVMSSITVLFALKFGLVFEFEFVSVGFISIGFVYAFSGFASVAIAFIGWACIRWDYIRWIRCYSLPAEKK
jgi:hypothetical protein